MKFESGPAREIQKISSLYLFKLIGFTGTGLAQPNIKPFIAPIIGKRKVPIISAWTIGFMLILPINLRDCNSSQKPNKNNAISCHTLTISCHFLLPCPLRLIIMCLYTTGKKITHERFTENSHKP